MAQKALCTSRLNTASTAAGLSASQSAPGRNCWQNRLATCAPGGASAHPECKSALTVIFERLRAGQGFPSCPQSGIKVSPEGYSPYMDCDRGYRAVETESRVVVCRGVAPDGRVIAITAKARANPQYVDITFLNGFNVRLWYSRGS